MRGSFSNANKLFLGRGALFADIWASGVATGIYKYLGVSSLYELAPPADEKAEMRDWATEDAGLLATLPTKRDMKMTAKIHELTLDVLKMKLAGTIGARAQGAASVTTQDIVSSLGNFSFVGKTNISEVVITPKPSGTALVEGEDYEVDYTTGQIYWMTLAEGGGATDATTYNIAFDHVADTSRLLNAGAATRIEGTLFFRGVPKVGQKMNIWVWHFEINNEGGNVGLIGSELGEIEIGLTALTDAANHPTCPYYEISERAEYTPPEA